MMKNFNNINYERIEFENTKILLDNLIIQLKKSVDINEYISIIKQINSIQNHIEEMCDYADIKNMRNLDDDFYKEEIEYWNDMKPKFDTLFLPYYDEINNSKFKEKLLKIMPSNFFEIIKYQCRITSDKVVVLQKEENELKTKYRNLNKTKILFDGEEKTIATISSFFTNKDRSIRKKAHDAVNDFYYNHQNDYDSIIYNLIKVRNKIANNLGFNNYKEYSLFKLKRFGYDYKDISKFRNNIVKYIIPICDSMTKWQKEELKLDKLEYFDTIFFEKMPQIKLKGSDLLNELRKSFNNVDNELSHLFNEMLDNNYIDLEQRDNKLNIGITNYLTESCMPVITGNFKNTYFDIQLTTHEMGHSFQKYCASLKDKDYIVSPLLKYPTMEIAEMFSYAMELIMMDYVNNIFSVEDCKKYGFMKVFDLVSNLPYICLVDEFQENIYTRENIKVEDIRNKWLELVNKYHMEKNNSGHINLTSGGYFYRQSHIYLNPFYYIDYGLSYFGAFAIKDACENNLKLFKELAEVASYYSFNDLINKYNMPNPFDDKTVKDTAIKLENELKMKKLLKR